MAEQRCRICGCTWHNACLGGCWWVEADLCSSCVDDANRSSAVLSACGTYRYRLERRWAGGHGTVAFIGVNPSTADAATDDQTVRKWRGYASRWGFSGFVVGNLFAYRATDVAELQRAEDPVGPHNDLHLLEILDATLVVPCWGARAKLPKKLHSRIDQVCQTLRDSRRQLLVLGLSTSGDPLHPLTLGYDRQLQAWSP